MSFLQTMCATKNIQNKPSPAKRKVFVQKLLSQIKEIIALSVKGTFGFISYMKNKTIRGSMTIEAAVLLPMLLFFFMHLASVMEMLRFHGKMETALWNVGNQMAVYIDSFANENDVSTDTLLSWVLVNGQIRTFLGKEYLENCPLVYGAAGLNYLLSDCLNQEECIDIQVTYQVAPQVSIFPFLYRRMYSGYYGRAWTGYDVSGPKTGRKYVYVTPKGEVWHATWECSYLYHQVDEVSKSEVQNRYEVCEWCKDQEQREVVYITSEGEKYHLLPDCRAIYKKVIALKWEEGMYYRACSRCVK